MHPKPTLGLDLVLSTSSVKNTPVAIIKSTEGWDLSRKSFQMYYLRLPKPNMQPSSWQQEGHAFSKTSLPILVSHRDLTDNSTASKATNKSIRIRQLQSTAMRYDWIQDRIAAGQFKVLWGAGVETLADFFTKTHPVHHHKSARRSYVHDGNEKAKRPTHDALFSKKPKTSGSI
jgi:hypothetical protein